MKQIAVFGMLLHRCRGEMEVNQIVVEQPRFNHWVFTLLDRGIPMIRIYMRLFSTFLYLKGIFIDTGHSITCILIECSTNSVEHAIRNMIRTFDLIDGIDWS